MEKEERQTDETEDFASLARRFKEAPVGDPEGLGIKLLDRVIATRERAEKAGVDMTQIRLNPIVAKAVSLAVRWEGGDSEASVELLNLIIETRKAAGEEIGPEQKPIDPEPKEKRLGLWGRIRKLLQS